MELKPGYKQTEVGEIPEDWECQNLGSICEFTQGIQIAQSNLSKNPRNGFIRYLYIRDFFTDDFPWYVEDIYSRKIMTPIDIMMVNTGNTAGKVYSGKYGVLSNNAFKITFNEQLIVRGYLFSLLRSHIVQDSIQELFNSSGQPHVGHKNIALVSIPLPPTKAEQTAIANALSDADALIQSLTRLIAKKRQIKQGAMQTLLNPYENGRLKEGWVVKKLSDICWFQEGPGLRNWQFTMSGMKVINVTNLENGYLNLEKTDRHISYDEFNKMYRHFEIDENDIVMASSGNSYSKVAVVRKQDLPLVMNTSVIRFKPLKGLQYNYLLIFLKSHNFKNQIDLLITGGAQPNFGPAHLKKIKIVVPEDEKKQTRIATILSGMDTEIAMLETKLAKYQHIKQGMMQNLLTGRIRLVKPESNTGAVA